MPVVRCVVKARLEQLSHIAPCPPTRRVGCSPGMAAFLDGLIESEAEDLRSIGRIRSYGAHVTLFHEGDDAGPVIVLLAGRVKVTSPGSAGREVIVAVRGPGDLLGEMS